jgi:hypothetical protein
MPQKAGHGPQVPSMIAAIACKHLLSWHPSKRSHLCCGQQLCRWWQLLCGRVLQPNSRAHRSGALRREDRGPAARGHYFSRCTTPR